MWFVLEIVGFEGLDATECHCDGVVDGVGWSDCSCVVFGCERGVLEWAFE